jgi:hypothetical protein
MHPLFIAHGPAFKNDFKIKSFRNVDIYPLMCHILGVSPAAHNGSLTNVIDMLATQSSYSSTRMNFFKKKSLTSIRKSTFFWVLDWMDD